MDIYFLKVIAGKEYKAKFEHVVGKTNYSIIILQKWSDI